MTNYPDEARELLRSERWAIRAILIARAGRAARRGWDRVAAVLRDVAEQVWSHRQRWE